MSASTQDSLQSPAANAVLAGNQTTEGESVADTAAEVSADAAIHSSATADLASALASASAALSEASFNSDQESQSGDDDNDDDDEPFVQVPNPDNRVALSASLRTTSSEITLEHTLDELRNVAIDLASLSSIKACLPSKAPKAVKTPAAQTTADALDTAAAPVTQPKPASKKRRVSQSAPEKNPKTSKKQKKVKSAAVMPISSSPNPQAKPAEVQVVKISKDEPVLGCLSPAFKGEAARRLVQGAHWREEIRHHFVVPYTMDISSLTILQDPEGWLDDTIVICYVHLLQKALEPEARSLFACLDSILVATIRSETGLLPDHQNYYASQLKKLRSAKLIFVPIHYAEHWALAVIDVVEHHYILGDSAATNGTFAEVQHLVHPILKFLVSNGVVETFAEGGSWDYLGNPFRQQNNRNDCGLFVLAGLKYIMETASARYWLPISQAKVAGFCQHVLFELAMGKVASFCSGPNFYLTVTGHRSMRQRVGCRKPVHVSTAPIIASLPAPVSHNAIPSTAVPEAAVDKQNASKEVPAADDHDKQGLQPLVADPVLAAEDASNEVHPDVSQGFQEPRALAPEGASTRGSSTADVPPSDKVTARTVASERDVSNEVLSSDPKGLQALRALVPSGVSLDEIDTVQDCTAAVATKESAPCDNVSAVGSPGRSEPQPLIPEGPASREDASGEVSAVTSSTSQELQPSTTEDIGAAAANVRDEASGGCTISGPVVTEENASREVPSPVGPQEFQEFSALAPEAAANDMSASAVGFPPSTPRLRDKDPELPNSIRLVRTAFNRANQYLSQLEARHSPRA
ncbi:hypothetical protein KEM56_002155, partial [Ascosphaera pollenicola]